MKRDERIVLDVILDESADAVLRDALRHNVAVRAIAETDTIETAREKLSMRMLIQRRTR